jgi:hypothetical protein
MGGNASNGSLASVGLSAYSTMLQAQGTATADEYQANKLEVAAQYGEVKANQTGAQMTRSLNNTLGNIEAVRAAAHADPNSPTGQAVIDNQEKLGIDQRTIAVGNIRQQAAQDKADAAYYRQAADSALFNGAISTAAGIAKSVAPLMIGL